MGKLIVADNGIVPYSKRQIRISAMASLEQSMNRSRSLESRRYAGPKPFDEQRKL